MKNMKFWRTALVATLVLTVMLSVTGGTIAWFTDTVTSGSNVIQSGNLDVTLEYKNELTDETWLDASEATIFNYPLWEPGYTDVKYVKIANAGNLAFKYKVEIVPKADPVPNEANLADVIEVYYGFDTGNAPTSTAALHEWDSAGTVAELMADEDGAAYGKLLPANEEGTEDAPAGSVEMWIALHMKEKAGNEYQNKSVGGGFILRLVATQLTYEEDSFGADYDENAAYPAAGAAEYNGVSYDTLADAIVAASEAGGGVITLNKSHNIAEQLPVSGNVTINGNGFTISRASGYTGTVFSVAEGATLTMKDVTVDGGAVWTGEVDATLGRGTINSGVAASGNLIATEGNGSIVLDEGTVLQNNVGSHAVSLATRGGGSLTLNGAQIINNSSDSGAIWGGGDIIVNAGSKINSNSSTGSAGAIRMVGDSDLTMAGGEISNNKAAGDGGAIWGYGSSTYNFNGGKMSGNEAVGTGGAIYTGNYSEVNISGDFELSGNKASSSGAIRLTDHTSMNMTGGTIEGNTQNGETNAFNTWNNSISITGGTISDNFSYVGGLGLTIGAADIDGVIFYDLSTNHNTAYLTVDFASFQFMVGNTYNNFDNFNFKPADGYTYTAGDEDKLVCMNEGYTTYWDAATGTFRLKAK